MPLTFSETLSNSTQIRLWTLTETEADLLEGLTLSDLAKTNLNRRKSELHRKHYLAIRQLLLGLGIAPFIHQYNAFGAPYLTDGRYVSITHTKDLAAVVLSPSPVGIDVEYYQEKIKKIAPRFLHAEEASRTHQQDQVDYLTQIWTAKEALYKVFGQNGVHFSQQLLIHPFAILEPKGKGSVFIADQQHDYHLFFRYFENYCLTLAQPY